MQLPLVQCSESCPWGETDFNCNSKFYGKDIALLSNLFSLSSQNLFYNYLTINIADPFHCRICSGMST